MDAPTISMEKLIYRRGAVGATDAILDKTVLLSTGKSDSIIAEAV